MFYTFIFNYRLLLVTSALTFTSRAYFVSVVTQSSKPIGFSYFTRIPIPIPKFHLPFAVVVLAL